MSTLGATAAAATSSESSASDTGSSDISTDTTTSNETATSSDTSQITDAGRDTGTADTGGSDDTSNTGSDTGSDTDAGSGADSGSTGDDPASAAATASDGKGAGDKKADGKKADAKGDAAKASDTDAWRTLIAGENQDILKELARIKTPADLGKILMDQKKALSKRAEAPKLPDNATPKQVAEYRKLVGVPEVPEGAKPDDFAKAYGIVAPKDYSVSEVEKAMLGDFAQVMHEKHVPAPMVKEAADFFFRAQTANAQNLNKLDLSRGKEWSTALKDELGRDYEPMLAAGKAFLDREFADNPQGQAELLNARLPGGGRLGDNPWFIKRVIDAALNNGFADRIEANDMEQGGKSLGEQQQELERLAQTDKARYDLPETQKKLTRIIELRLNRGEINEMGEPVRKKRA